MTPIDKLIAAARAWQTARQACLSASRVTPAEYARLANAEADLAAAVRELPE